MHIFMEAELLAVKRDGGIDIMDEVADLYRSHMTLLERAPRR
jgi:hypothetical protein